MINFSENEHKTRLFFYIYIAVLSRNLCFSTNFRMILEKKKIV